LKRARLGVLISGSGRTALNLANACESGSILAEVALVVAHREELEGVTRCRDAGLRVAIIPPAAPLSDAFADRIDAVFLAAQVDLVCLAGYLRKFRVGNLWCGRALNIHPGLLPDFGGHGMYGERVHRAVLAAGVTESGCTIHEVDEEYDRGPVILEKRCAITPGESATQLAERVFALECLAYPEAIAMVLARRDRGWQGEGAPLGWKIAGAVQ
jgi:phosphoribosylglycinamide formyltransferase-1